MNRSRFTARRLWRAMAMFSVLLMALPAWTQPTPGLEKQGKDRSAKPKAAQEAGKPKQERNKAKKGSDSAKAEDKEKKAKPLAFQAPTSHTRQYAEDFDRAVNWEQKAGKTTFGYSATNHLGSAGCAPGEIGGQVSSGIAWFADTIAAGPVLLDPSKEKLSASGWCQFEASGAGAAMGWFNADSYSAPDSAPDCFIGWRQNGQSLCAAVGTTGSSFAEGNPIALSCGTPVQWTLAYNPTGGEGGCGLVTLSVGNASSVLSLTQEQQKALAAGKFNRFGIVSAGADKASTLWLDNLIYTKVTGLPALPAKAMAHTRTDFFDADPTGKTWFGDNNIMPHEPATVTMDYKYQPSGGGAGYEGASGDGCIGGIFNNAIGTSYYAYKYSTPLHFTDKLRTEGHIQFPSVGGAVAQLGWSNSKNALSWREPNVFGFRFMTGKNGMLDISVDLAVKTFQGAGGNMATQALPSVAAGSGWHHYVLEFDPNGNSGDGTITVQFDDKKTTFNMPPGKKALGADFDLFGMWNQKCPAKSQTSQAYADDIKNTVNGKPDPSTYNNSTWYGNFSKDPGAYGWVGVNNSFTAKDNIVRPYHQFGYVKSLKHLDGLNGYSPMYTISPSERYCVGGIIYLANFGMTFYASKEDYDNNKPNSVTPPGEQPTAWYGADLGGLLNTREHHMVATGRVKLDWASTDAAQMFGWFNSATAREVENRSEWYVAIRKPTHDKREKSASRIDINHGKTMPKNFIGVQIHGGSAAGYSMMPGYRSPLLFDEHASGNSEQMRIYQDGEWRNFHMEYDPAGAGGKGQIKVQLGDDGNLCTYDLEEGAKGEKFAFDRFGFVTMRKGGGKPHAIYLDALTYTVAP